MSSDLEAVLRPAQTLMRSAIPTGSNPMSAAVARMMTEFDQLTPPEHAELASAILAATAPPDVRPTRFPGGYGPDDPRTQAGLKVLVRDRLDGPAETDLVWAGPRAPDTK